MFSANKTKINWIESFFYRAIHKIYRFYHDIYTRSLVKQFYEIGVDSLVDFNVIAHSPENIKIGSKVFIGRNVILAAYDHITIGDGCAIAAGCKLISGNHSYSKPLNDQEVEDYILEPIVLKNDVWLGYNVIVLPGVILGRGCTVAAGSVVTKSFPEFSIIAGVPAKTVKMRNDFN